MKLIKDIFGRDNVADKIAHKIVMMSDNAVLALDRNLNIIMMNPEAENIFGYHAQELIGQPYDLLIPEHQRRAKNEIMTGFLSGRENRQVINERGHLFSGLRKGGDEFQLHITMIKFVEAGRPYLAFIMRDISEDKESEDENLKLLTMDSLTGLHNRRHFIKTAECEALRARRYDRPLSFVVIDLDSFQDFNAQYGHEAGDKMLQRIAGICKQTLRNIDILGRWSGGEFIILLPETSATNANVIASRLGKLIADIKVDTKSGQANCTASIGISEFKKSESNIDLPIGRAVKAVMNSKNESGNKVSTVL